MAKLWIVVTAILSVCPVLRTGTAEAADAPASAVDKLVGQPVELSPWAYQWRADRPVQDKPDAWFIPRRLERLDKVYRPMYEPGTNKPARRGDPMLPPPKGRLCSGLLLLAPTPIRRVELHWPEDAGQPPPPDAVEVRVYLKGLGWFSGARDATLAPPKLSDNGRIWEYLHENDAKGKSDVVTEMVAVFLDEGKLPAGAKPACPQIRLFSPQTWKRMDLEIEWGLKPGTEKTAFDGHLESYVGLAGAIAPLAEDQGTAITGNNAWRSSSAGDARRGIKLSLAYIPRPPSGPIRGGRPPLPPPYSTLDTRITLWTKGGNLTFLPGELDSRTVVVPDLGFAVMKSGSGKTGRQCVEELAAKNLKCLPQMTREHPEISSWEELMRQIKFDPSLKDLPPLQPFEEAPATAMRVQLPDPRWNDAWRRSSGQLKTGNGGYPDLTLEVGRPIHAMDMVGLHETSGKRLDYWLKSPGAMAAGEFVDGEGSLQYGAGTSYAGIHPQTGWLLFALAEHYRLSGEKEWFLRNRPRMQAAADWIVRQRRLYLQDVPNREALECAGLQPPQGLGDVPADHWRWFLLHDAYSLKGLRGFADALAEFDAPAAKKYRDEGDAYAADLLRAIEREMALSPVRSARDGAFHRWIPASLYARGTMVREIYGAYALVDISMGPLALADAFGVLDPRDARVGDHLNLVEERLLSLRKDVTLADDPQWFFNGKAELVKYSLVGDIHLRRDDVPCFLRHWMINYASYVSPHGGFGEWTGTEKVKAWDPAGQQPGGDLMNTAWFMENFRNLLVMEQDDVLWLARATPRAWLEQGKKIAVTNAPTYFGTVAYEIVSDVDNGKIAATTELPSRKPPKTVLLRLRHPKAVPIKGVTVNGKEWKDFNKEKETINLTGLSGTVSVTVQY